MTRRKPKISYRELLDARDATPPAEGSAVPAPVAATPRTATPIALAAVLNAGVRAATPAATSAVVSRVERRATPRMPTPVATAAISEEARAMVRGTRRTTRGRGTSATRVVADVQLRVELAATGRAELLRFRVGHERFALRLADVEEALESPILHPLPDLPRHVLGVCAIRGRLVPVHAPAHVLGVAVGSPGVALVLCGDPPLAIAVDDVEDVFTIEAGALRHAPGVDDPDGVLLGVTRSGGRLVGVLDATALADACLAPASPDSR